jgi:hypothetical protein
VIKKAFLGRFLSCPGSSWMFRLGISVGIRARAAKLVLMAPLAEERETITETIEG